MGLIQMESGCDTTGHSLGETRARGQAMTPILIGLTHDNPTTNSIFPECEMEYKHLTPYSQSAKRSINIQLRIPRVRNGV